MAKLFWKLYSCLFFVLVLSDAQQLLNKNSPIEVYYNTTLVFSIWFIAPYLLNILNAVINGIVCVLIFGYSFDAKDLGKIPLWFLCLRVVSDCTGHSYEWKIVESGFSQGPWPGLSGLIVFILPILPSYILHWRMTFNPTKKGTL